LRPASASFSDHIQTSRSGSASSPRTNSHTTVSIASAWMFGCRQSHIFPSSGAANPYPSAINVGGLRRGKVLDVNMTLHNITHGSSNDIDVLLVGPGGRTPSS
jgi:hypothetical protein